MTFSYRIPALLCIAAGLASSCNDDIVCVFTTGCQGGGSGALSEETATLPEDGLWIVDGPPEVVSVFPSGNENPETTPIVVRFTESMNPDTLDGAVEIVPLFGGIPDQPLSGVAEVLVGDGRVLVLLPGPLLEGDFLVRVGAAKARATDLTGQVLAEAAGAQLGQFTVSPNPPEEPRLVASYPADLDQDQAQTSEIVVVFDREIQDDTVDDASFVVKVDGADPASDPPPVPLVVDSDVEPRVFRYRSADPDGAAIPFGPDIEVEVTLSPAGAPILDEDGDDPLARTTFQFTTAEIGAPLGGTILSAPPDAIGLANLTDLDPQELQIEVELDSADTGDFVDTFIVGKNVNANGPELIAIQRSVQLVGTPPILVTTLTRETLAIQLSEDPADVRFADDALAFAFRSRRGNVVTPLRVLDVDLDRLGIQDPVLDTTAPTISEFLLIPDGSLNLFRSDQRDIVIAGDASELLRSVEITTPTGDNGPLPPVIGSDSSGLFLAAPVPAGVLVNPTTTFTAVAFDAALNPSTPVEATFVQQGGVGPTPFAPGDPLMIDVFDAGTLAPLTGALVLVHSDAGDGMNYPFHVSGTTFTDGKVTLTSAGAPSTGAIVTVVLAGYDLFTFHGVTAQRVSIPLQRVGNPVSSNAVGRVVSEDAGVIAFYEGLQGRLDDSRRPPELARGFEGSSCTAGATLSCPYGREPIFANRLGARSVVAGDFLQDTSFNSVFLVQAFALAAPLGPSPPSGDDPRDIDVPFLLTDNTLPEEEKVFDLPDVVLSATGLSGIDLANLDDDPATTGDPRIDVEALVPGIGGAVQVGMGLAYGPPGATSWDVRSAAPGAVSAAGSLGSDGVVDSDLLLRMELRDDDDNVTGVRPRQTVLEGLPANPVLVPADVPVLVSPPPGGSTGGDEFTLVFPNTIEDLAAEPGLYRVDLEDPAGRGWTLWRPDTAGSENVRVRVPDPGDAGATGLASGNISVRISAFAWPTFNPRRFLWSDVEREHDLFARAASVTLTKP